jgi:hypothetical protein
MFSTRWKIKQPISWSGGPVFFGLFTSYRALKYRFVGGKYEEKWMPSSYDEITRTVLIDLNI